MEKTGAIKHSPNLVGHPGVDVQPKVVFTGHAALGEFGLEHFLMLFFTVFNLLDQTTSRFGKHSEAASEEALPPFTLGGAGTLWTLARSDADKDADFSCGPFIIGFPQDLNGRVVFAGALVGEDALSYLDGFECQPGRTGGSPGLPDGAVEFRRRFSA